MSESKQEIDIDENKLESAWTVAVKKRRGEQIERLLTLKPQLIDEEIVDGKTALSYWLEEREAKKVQSYELYDEDEGNFFWTSPKPDYVHSCFEVDKFIDVLLSKKPNLKKTGIVFTKILQMHYLLNSDEKTSLLLSLLKATVCLDLDTQRLILGNEFSQYPDILTFVADRFPKYAFSLIDLTDIKANEDILKQTRANKVLFSVVKTGKILATQFLISRGANVNALDETGRTPAMHAVYARDEKMLECLLANNGQFNVPALEGHRYEIENAKRVSIPLGTRHEGNMLQYVLDNIKSASPLVLTILVTIEKHASREAFLYSLIINQICVNTDGRLYRSMLDIVKKYYPALELPFIRETQTHSLATNPNILMPATNERPNHTTATAFDQTI